VRAVKTTSRNDFAVGDRVWWTGYKDFGKTPVRRSGVITSLDCGIPYYTDPPVWVEYQGQTFHKEAGRHPAAAIKPDREPLPGEPPIVIAFKDLSHAE
jgi:hypothetical protein